MENDRISRRSLLVGAGAALTDLTLPSFASSASAFGRGSRASARLTAQILPDPRNPYFQPLGGPGPAPIGGYPTVHRAPTTTATTAPLTTSATPLTANAAPALTVNAAAAAPAVNTLILYDTTNTWGWLGEIYAIMTANLVSHFGAWTTMPVVNYAAGTLKNYTAVIYIGSTYGEPIPAAFLADVSGATIPVIWIYDNIWQFTAYNASFQSQYGWMWSGFDYSSVAQVNYKIQLLKRYSANATGIMNYAAVNSPAAVLATCVRSDGTTFPWAVRSGNLTYIGEIPFAYISEGDRYLIFCDLLFDALAPSTTTSHLALLRLEDIDCLTDPTTLQTVAAWLKSQGIPYGFQVIPHYLDPSGYYNGGVPVNTSLSAFPKLISVFKQMQAGGGAMILHGWTHQYSNVANPYTGVSGDDAEFYRITLNPDQSLNYVGPVTEDSLAWAQNRYTSAKSDLAAAGFAMPTLHTFPSYAGSAIDSRLVATSATLGFKARAERVLYFSGLTSWLANNGQTPIDYTRVAGQFFPYSVVDVYGGRVLSDTLGGIQPQQYYSTPPRLPADIIADAQRTLVVRNGVASFFFNSSDSISYLKQTVQGIQKLGYKFVSPSSL